MGKLDEIRKTGNDAELLNVIRSGPTSARKDIDWPGREDVRIRLRLLPVSEGRKARILNEQEFAAAKIKVEFHNLNDFRAQEAAFALAKAILDPSTDEPLFRSADHLRAFVTDDELGALSKAYNTFSEEENPDTEDYSDEQIRDLFEALKKTPDLIPGKVTNLSIAWRLLLISVSPQET